ncbi:transposase, partial [Rhodococcus cerastii]|nr:transposase [Rhodococcus cerastii]
MARRSQDFQDRDLSGTDFVYLGVDGIHLEIHLEIRLEVRLEQEKLCLSVMIGVRADGRKELVALADGYRESTGSWADPVRRCRRRGMTGPCPGGRRRSLAGSGRQCGRCSPDTREQRCWFHTQSTVLASLP